jgi:hypothetical protein
MYLVITIYRWRSMRLGYIRRVLEWRAPGIIHGREFVHGRPPRGKEKPETATR